MIIKGISLLHKFKIRAIVLFPFILFAENDPDEFLLNHERIHWDQVKRDCVFSFYRRYLWEYYRGVRKGLTHDQAYRSISY